jgi:hypothetical protein
MNFREKPVSESKEVTMKRSWLTIASLSVIIAFLVPYASARAQASVQGGVSVSAGVAVTTQPAPVVVAPAPVVVVAPAPPPVVVVQKPPPKVIIKTPPLLPPFEKQIGFGLRLDWGFHGHEHMHGEGMGGGGLLLRMRLLPHFATEIGLDAYGGEGYDGAKRVEVPFSIGLMWMPMYYLTRVQFYTIGGMGGAWAKVGEDPHADKPFYLGVFIGAGFELKLGVKRRLALFTDLRGFIRKRLNDRPEDILIPDGGSCKGSGELKECTDWEGGVLWSIGIVAYF